MEHNIKYRGKSIKIILGLMPNSHRILYVDGNRSKEVIFTRFIWEAQLESFLVQYTVIETVDGKVYPAEGGSYMSDETKNEYANFYAMAEAGVKVQPNVMNAIVYRLFGINCFNRLTGECYQPVTFDVANNGESFIVSAMDGIAPFQYSIDNGVTYVTTNEFLVESGEYNIVVKDSVGTTEKLVYNHIAVTPEPTPTV